MPFSSKTVYSGEVVTNLAIPFDDHEDFTRNALMTGALSSTPMTQAIKDSILNGFSATADTYYRYGRDRYQFGLPTGTLRSGEVEEEPIRQAIQDIRGGQEVAIERISLDYADATSLAMHFLDRTYGFDVESLKIFDRVDSSTTGTFEQYLLTATFIPDEDKILIEYLYNDTLKELVYEIELFNRNQLYVIADYRVPSDDNRLRVWTYRTDSGLYPGIQLEALFSESEYMPVCAVRREFESVEPGTEEYRTAKEMLNIIGLNIDDITAALASDGSKADTMPSYPPTDRGDNNQIQMQLSASGNSPEPEENIPEEIRDAFVVFKADVNSTDQWVRRYLFQYFKDQAAFQLPLSRTKDVLFSGNMFYFRANELIIENEIIQSNIFFNFIEITTVEGSIGPVNEVRTEIDIQDPLRIGIPFRDNLEIEMSIVKYQKQVSETHYEEVKVHGLIHTHDIGGKYVVIRTLEDAIEPGNDTGFYLPVSQRVVKQFSNSYHQSQVYQSTLCVVVYALDSQKVKWYARGAFASLIQVAAIVWTIVSLGSDGGAALTLAFAIQVVTQIIVHIVINMALVYGLTLITEIIGAEAAMIIAAAVAAYSIYSGAFAGPEGMPWAQDLLQLGNATFGASQNVIQQNLADLSVEYENFMADAEADYDNMEEVNAMLKNESYTLTDIITRSSNEVFWESPTMFFNRTVHIGNPGVGILGTIETFIENKLDLPKDKPLF